MVISERMKVQCMYAGNLDVMDAMFALSNLISDVILIGMRVLCLCFIV
jgi:hypothetical protein